MNNRTSNREYAAVEDQGSRSNIVRFVLVCGLLMALLALAACTDAGPSATLVPVLTPTPNSNLAPPSAVIAGTSDSPGMEEVSTPESIVPPASTPQADEASTAPSPVTEVTPGIDVTPGTAATLPDGPLTIVALGDSLTEGDGDDWQRGGYPSRLSDMINKVRPGSNMVNLGKSGWTSDQMIAEQLRVALDAKPQIALVWIGSNDLWQFNAAEEEEADLKHYTANIDTTLSELKAAGATTFIAILDDQSLRPFARPENGYFDLDGLARMSRRITAYNKVIASKAAEYGAVTVDFFNTTIFTDPATLADDGLHPNPGGYNIVAKLWYEAIGRIL